MGPYMYAHNTQFVCFQCEAKKLTRFLGFWVYNKAWVGPISGVNWYAKFFKSFLQHFRLYQNQINIFYG